MPAVTLLLTDLQGSTALWERQPEEMSAALAWHDELFATKVPEHGGVVVKPRGEGDSIFATFPGAAPACACAIDLQMALAEAPHAPTIPMRVRVAIHTGEAEFRNDDYYGQMVNRCARVRGVVHGGQIVLTSAAVEDVGSDLPPDAGLLDLGNHVLRDLLEPERLYQLTHPALPADFPPLGSIRPGPHNLPGDRGSFVGRDSDVAGVTGLLERDRVVTLLGTGGLGKTRLAVRVARSLVGRFPGGRWFVDLSDTPPSHSVIGAIATALGLSGEGTSGLMNVVKNRLQADAALLVLDNCEHVIESAAEVVDDLVEACPDLHVLATSRERLQVYGEQVWRLEPLPVPQDVPADLEAARLFPAVELFLDRAGAVAPDVSYGDADADLLVGLCRRLDGLPLSIELAAARADGWTLPQIHAGLDDRLRLLSDGPRGRSERQRSLEALLGWSYDLLEPDPRRVLRRLGILRGGFDLPTASVVVGLPEEQVRVSLDRLVECSLVDRRSDDVAPFRLLETIRDYADSLMDQQERASATRGAMEAMTAAMAELMRDPVRTPQRRAVLRAAAPDLRWLLDHALTEGAEQEALSAAYGIWQTSPDVGEGIRAFRLALELPGGDSPVRAQVLGHAGLLVANADEVEQGEEMVEAALAMAQRLDAPELASRALNALALIAQRSDVERMQALALEHLAVASRCEHHWYTALARTNLGIAAEIREDPGTAEAEHRAALEGYLAAGDQYGVAISRTNLGDAALVRGAHDEAAEHLAAAAEIFATLDSTDGRFWAAFGLGSVALSRGDVVESARHLQAALKVASLLAWPGAVGDLLGCVAAHAAVGEHWEAAATLLGAADALGLDPTNPAFAGKAPAPTQVRAETQEALGPDVAAETAEAGAALSLQAAIAHAVAYVENVLESAALEGQ